MMLAYVVLLILFATARLLALGHWPVDLVALGVLLLLIVTGILTPEEGLAGFAAPVTLIVVATYMLGAGLRRTGAAALIGNVLTRLAGEDERRIVVALVLLGALLSAFMANLAVFALMLPATLTLVERYKLRPGKVLMALSIASNAGGLLTLLGSMPQLAASDILKNAGYEPFHLFSLTPIALPAVLFTAAYLATVAQRFLPEGEYRRPVRPTLPQIAREYGLERGLQELRVRQGSSLIGRPLRELNLREEYGVSILEIQRGNQRISPPPPEMALQPNDIIIVEGKPGGVAQLAAQHNLESRSRVSLETVARRLPEDIILAEVLIPPRSPLAGHTPSEVNLRARFGIHAISLLRDGKALAEGVRTTRLRVGDSLLVEGPRAAIRRAAEEGWLIVAHYLEEEPGIEPTPKVWVAWGIVLMMVITAGAGWLPLVISSMLAVLLMLATGCLKPYEMYRVVHWRTVVMIAALLPLGTAMEKSGAAQVLGEALVALLAPLGPHALLVGFFLLPLILTQVLSNTAVTVLLAPVAISVSRGLGVAPHPFVLAVVFGSSASFLTPITDALNIMVREHGKYRFRDYVLASGPTVAIFLIMLLVLT